MRGASTMSPLVIAVLSMGGMGTLFAAGLAIANSKLRVEEDPRIERVLDLLPGVNCGACGMAGCAAFAAAVVGGADGHCPIANDDARCRIAEVLGRRLTATEKLLPRVLCRGGRQEAKARARYEGIKTCATADLVGKGHKACTYGCLGFSDCCVACDYDALHMNENGLPVLDEAKCVSCGACAKACPRDLIEMHPESRKIFVWCKSRDDARTARANCAVSCIACGVCARTYPPITMQGNLAVIDYAAMEACDKPFPKCPTGAFSAKVE